MTTATQNGRNLREELNELHHKGLELQTLYQPYIKFDFLGDVSLLMRRAKRYATMQENACSYEWASGEAWDRKESRLRESIVEVAKQLPGVKGVKFTGDPRGFTVRLILDCGKGNTWGGDEDGWGIA